MDCDPARWLAHEDCWKRTVSGSSIKRPLRCAETISAKGPTLLAISLPVRRGLYAESRPALLHMVMHHFGIVHLHIAHAGVGIGAVHGTDILDLVIDVDTASLFEGQ